MFYRPLAGFLTPKIVSPPRFISAGGDASPLPVCLAFSRPVRCSVVFAFRSLVQTVVLFFRHLRQQTKKKESRLSDPWPLTPAPGFASPPRLRAPRWGVRVCVQVRGGVVCPGISGRLQDSFPVETGFPLRSSLSRSLTLLLVHSLARSAQDQTPISVSWRREQTFTVDELSSSSNTSLKLSDFHEIKTLFLIMFF